MLIYSNLIAREKSFDYFLIIYKKQFLSRFSTLRDKWSVKLFIGRKFEMFPPIDVNGLSKIDDDSKQELAATKSNTEYIIEKRELKSVIKWVTLNHE